MELNDYRKRLDDIDAKILSLFSERMGSVLMELSRSRQERILHGEEDSGVI